MPVLVHLEHLFQDLSRLFPEEQDMVQITLVEAKEILSSFDGKLRNYTERLIRRRKNMKIHKASVNGNVWPLQTSCHMTYTSTIT